MNGDGEIRTLDPLLARQDYIDGKKELREINMEFNARYVKSEDMPGREGCGYQGR